MLVATRRSPNNVLAVVKRPVELQAVDVVVLQCCLLSLLDFSHTTFGVQDHGQSPSCIGGYKAPVVGPSGQVVLNSKKLPRI